MRKNLIPWWWVNWPGENANVLKTTTTKNCFQTVFHSRTPHPYTWCASMPNQTTFRLPEVQN
jgi:hypothetical protein